MKNFTNLFNLNNIIKILVIFSIGFIFRIIIYYYLGINVFLDYTNSVSILYYLGLSSFSVYFDHLFSFQYINVEPTNNIIKSFDNNSLLFNKDFTSSKLSLDQKIRCKLSWYSLGNDKNAFATYEEYKLTWDPKTKIWIEIKNFVKWSVHWTNNESTGNTNIVWQELEERRRIRRDHELERRALYTRLSWKKEK